MIWRLVERIWRPVERIWREREIAAGEGVLEENRSGREKTQVRRTEKEGKGPTNRLRNRRVRRLIGSAALFLALELGAKCDAKIVVSLFSLSST